MSAFVRSPKRSSAQVISCNDLIWCALAGVRFTELMHGLASKRVDFYFAGILVQTGRMAHLMSECYAYSHNASFKVRPFGNGLCNLCSP